MDKDVQCSKMTAGTICNAVYRRKRLQTKTVDEWYVLELTSTEILVLLLILVLVLDTVACIGLGVGVD